MSETSYGEWRDVASAPKDGTRILVEIRASEQGPAEVDMARWAKPERAAEACWVSTESDPGAVITYAESEVLRWMPLPSPLPRTRPGKAATARRAGTPPPGEEEIGGSGI